MIDEDRPSSAEPWTSDSLKDPSFCDDPVAAMEKFINWSKKMADLPPAPRPSFFITYDEFMAIKAGKHPLFQP